MSDANYTSGYQIFSSSDECWCVRKRKRGQSRHTKDCARKRKQRGRKVAPMHRIEHL